MLTGGGAGPRVGWGSDWSTCWLGRGCFKFGLGEGLVHVLAGGGAGLSWGRG